MKHFSTIILAQFTCLYLLTACDNNFTKPSEQTPKPPAQSVPAGSSPSREGDTFSLLQEISANELAGMQVHKIQHDEAAMILLVLSKDQFQPAIAAYPQRGMSVTGALAASEHHIVIGSSFVSQLHSLEPVGLLQQEGTIVNEIQRHGYTRILGVNDLGLGVIHKQEYERGIFHSAIQVGPGIVEKGELDISEKDLERPKYFRSFVGICENHYLAGFTTSPSHLRSVGAGLVAFSEAQSLQCEEVVNLAGDRQAVVGVRSSDSVVFHGDPSTHKVGLIGFTYTDSSPTQTAPDQP